MFLTLSFDLQYVNCKLQILVLLSLSTNPYQTYLNLIYQESPFDFNPSKRGLRYYTNKKTKIVKKKIMINE